MKKILILLLCGILLLSVIPAARAEQSRFRLDLSAFIQNPLRRQFVESMVNYALYYDPAVKQTLADGYTAIFFFEGCSDNMDDEELSDISYYRVSAVCVALKLQQDGEIGLIYFNGNCSTLPDRPLEYGKWYLADVGKVGPATVRDGTYEVYSVKHNGAYEALHMQTSQEDDTIAAVYMTPEGYVTAQANAINIHTRTGNHVIEKAMWSAGCLLVGDGDFGSFTELVQSTYYSRYDAYEKNQMVGTVTINRQMLKQELYELYENKDAVDMLLANSRQILPEKYLETCGETVKYDQSRIMLALGEVEMLTLPCSNATDPRSVTALALETGQEVTVTGCIRNSEGNIWYIAQADGRNGYVYSGYLGEKAEITEEPEEVNRSNWFDKLLGWMK